jgi:cob(I)alamin adenosyltransferase
MPEAIPEAALEVAHLHCVRRKCRRKERSSQRQTRVFPAVSL